MTTQDMMSVLALAAKVRPAISKTHWGGLSSEFIACSGQASKARARIGEAAGGQRERHREESADRPRKGELWSRAGQNESGDPAGGSAQRCGASAALRRCGRERNELFGLSAPEVEGESTYSGS